MPLLSLRAYARHRGVSLKAVQKAIESGRITAVHGKIDPARADQEWERHTEPRPKQQVGAGLKPAPTEAPAPGGYQQARAIREQYAARLARLHYQERIGKLLDREQVEAEAFNRFRIFRDLLLGVPDRLAALLAAETDQVKVRELLDREIRTSLTQFADESTGAPSPAPKS